MIDKTGSEKDKTGSDKHKTGSDKIRLEVVRTSQFLGWRSQCQEQI